MIAPPFLAFKERVLDILYPPQCLRCLALVAETNTLCSICWREISFIEGAGCDVCGLPFEFDLGPNALCGACSQQRPIFNRARAVLIYNAASRDLILSFKHGDKTHAATAYGKWLFRMSKNFLKNQEKIDLILPVPLHWSRLFHRRYNQAALLALELGKLAQIPVETTLLRRHKKTASQGHKTTRQRHQNLIGAFSVLPKTRHQIKNKRLLLVDDVFTTGATASTCAQVLLSAGADQVDVLTLARVVRTDTAPHSLNDDDLLI